MSNMYRSVLASGGGVQPTGDAVAADVLTGKTFSNASAVGIAGTMPNNGAVSGQATPSQPYTIPAGYHNGSGVVTGSGAQPTTIPYTSQSVTAGVEKTIIEGITAQDIFLSVTNSNFFTQSFPNSNIKIYLNGAVAQSFNSSVLGSNPDINVHLTSRGTVKITATMDGSSGSGSLVTVGCYS